MKVLKLINIGAFGIIMLCKDESTESQFVLKIPITSVDSLYRDISIQCSINNPGVLTPYFQLINYQNQTCIAMKYYSNGSLLTLINNRKFSELELSKIFYQILLQIQEIHNNNIIHRDIKSDNIVFDENFNAKIIDFGMAKCISDCHDKQLEENLKIYKAGTWYYMAPEVMNSESYSHKIDIWSLGVTLIEAITDGKLYKGLNQMQIVIKVAKTKKVDFQPAQPISNELSMFIKSCLNSDPKERFDSTQLIETDFIQNYLKTLTNL